MARLWILFCVSFTWTCCHCQENKTAFTFEEALFGPYGQQSYSGAWISDSEIQYTDSFTRSIFVRNVVTDVVVEFLPRSVLDKYNSSGFIVSPDRKNVLILYDGLQGFRHSSSHRYMLYNIDTGKNSSVADGEYIQQADWSPAGDLLFVKENDIYLVPKSLDLSLTKRLTTTGVPGVIYNGVPDWVYEEEVLLGATAFWFSPKGDGLVYISFNDTQVPEITYMHYGKPGEPTTNYPQEVKIRYPKAGERNPSVSLHHVNLDEMTDTEVSLPLKDENVIIFGVQWISNNQYTTVITNRVQNESQILLCVAGDMSCTLLLEDKRENGWALTDLPKFSKDASRYLKITPRQVEGEGEFSHLALYENGNTTFLNSKEAIVVTGITAWDEENGIVYFTSPEILRPSSMQVYAAFENGSSQVCLSCNLMSVEGNRCSYASASFSANLSYVILTCRGPDPLFVTLLQNNAGSLTEVEVLVDNMFLRTSLKRKLLPTPFDFLVTVSGNFKAEGRLLLPPDVDLSGDTQYPLLIEVYAGPDSKQITDTFRIGWQTYLTTSLNIIYGYIDGRGSGLKGDDMLFAVYQALGTAEIEDQLNIGRFFKGLPYVDPNRVAIWGWSYGGYATGKVLEMDTRDVYKCGISVAPVTSWIYYDSIYTERYMRLPQENNDSYVGGDLLHDVSRLNNKKYYLIHGNGDDNVHYQQSMLFSRALELNDVIFQQQSYPDENHSLRGVTRHLYHSMDLFWKDCFNLTSPGQK